MIFVYNIVYLIGLLFYIPLVLLKGKWHSGFFKRFGAFEAPLIKKLSSRKQIWIHAVSVGEVLVGSQIVKELKRKYADCGFVCSTVTASGFKIAKKEFPEDVVVFAPYDLSWVVRKYIHAIQPVLYLSAETEIWPNVFLQLRKMSIPIVIVNGRISDKSFKGYKRVRFFLKKLLSCVSYFCMQNNMDAKKILELGAEENIIKVVGNIKFDVDAKHENVDKTDFGYSKNHRILVAGSTHKGEEEIILSIFLQLNEKFKDLRLIIAPRHVERVDEVKQYVLRNKLRMRLYTNENHGSVLSQEVLIIDEVGHLKTVYQWADICFIGKSLIDGGGQNIIEAAVYGKPIIVGPYMQNFRDALELFLREGAIRQVNNQKEACDVIKQWLDDPDLAKEFGANAMKVVRQNRGAVEKTLKYISECMSA